MAVVSLPPPAQPRLRHRRRPLWPPPLRLTAATTPSDPDTAWRGERKFSWAGPTRRDRMVALPAYATGCRIHFPFVKTTYSGPAHLFSQGKGTAQTV
jgi:hypothetical protein